MPTSLVRFVRAVEGGAHPEAANHLADNAGDAVAVGVGIPVGALAADVVLGLVGLAGPVGWAVLATAAAVGGIGGYFGHTIPW